jgi:hypothetical protein
MLVYHWSSPPPPPSPASQTCEQLSSAHIHLGVLVGCPSKLVSIRNNRNWNWHYLKQNVCFSCFASIPKQRVSVFWLNRNKQKTNRNSLIESIYWYFFIKFCVVLGCFSLFRFFSKQFVSVVSIPKQRVSMFWLNRNKQKTNRNSSIERIFWYFPGYLGWFRFVSVCSKQFCLFWLFQCRLETPKQTENKPKILVFGFTKQTETQPKQILFRFVSVRIKNIFFSFREHPRSECTVQLGKICGIISLHINVRQQK